MEQSVYSSKQVICLFPWLEKKSELKNYPAFFDSENNTFLTFTTFMQKYNFKGNLLQSFICNTIGMENYVKARMFSTIH